MTFADRMRAAGAASSLHFLLSCLIAVVASAVVFLVWYPHPYRDISGGRELFLLIIAVDIVCGPLLTLVLYNPNKPKTELWRDMALIAVIQLAALAYGMYTVWQVRPLYLVMEIDRFKVVTRLLLDEAALAQLPSELQPRWWTGPLVVGIREPKNAQEREKVLFESLQGGRDFAERPEFYQPYEGSVAAKSLRKAKPLAIFLQKHPDQKDAAADLTKASGTNAVLLFYLPVFSRKDWVAVIDSQGMIKGFLPGDGY